MNHKVVIIIIFINIIIIIVTFIDFDLSNFVCRWYFYKIEETVFHSFYLYLFGWRYGFFIKYWNICRNYYLFCLNF